jgi:DHA2 family multidrug resistance protein
MAQHDPTKATIEVKHRGWLQGALMLATIIQVLDTTIANVALPHMQASLNASQDEINWVLTSYIVAAAIATPLTGWIADKFGRRNVLVVAVGGFTVASVMCGMATSLPEMVMFRLIQGLFGALIAPLSQAVMLDINPYEKLGQAMALFGIGIMLGPIIGPTLGGYLTETFNWRAVFLVNLPIGILAMFALWVFMPKSEIRLRKFDFFGFGMLALAIGAIQLMLDRGQGQDWFSSPEILLYLGLAIAGLWVYVVHSLTAEHPFIDLRMFKDRNFTMGCVFMFMIGITVFSGLALQPPMLQSLMGYPVVQAGLIMAPRGLGTMASMMVVGRLVNKVDARFLVGTGILIAAYALYMMTQFDVDMDQMPIIVSGVVQGMGLGLIFVPLQTLAFATIAPHYRTDATAAFSLVRNVGQAVGISLVTTVLTQMIQVNHAELAERITPYSRSLNAYPQLSQHSTSVLEMLNGLVSQQAAMLAYLDDFKLMMWVTLASIPIVFFLKAAKPAPAKPRDGKAESSDDAAMHAMAE